MTKNKPDRIKQKEIILINNIRVFNTLLRNFHKKKQDKRWTHAAEDLEFKPTLELCGHLEILPSNKQ